MLYRLGDACILAEKVIVENNRKNKRKRDRWTVEWYGARESAETQGPFFEFRAIISTMFYESQCTNVPNGRLNIVLIYGRVKKFVTMAW